MINIEKTWSFLRQKFSVVDNRIPYKAKKTNKVEKEYILCSAIKRKVNRTENRITYKDNRIRDKFGILDDIYSIELGRRHCDIIARFGADELDLSQQGFYTSWGRFLNREDALSLAIENGQVIDHVHETKLFSEDLY